MNNTTTIFNITQMEEIDNNATIHGPVLHGHIKWIFLLYAIPLALMAIGYVKFLIDFVKRDREVNNNE